MNYSYPLLNKVFKHYDISKKDISNFKLYSCQHILEPQLEMFRKFINFGFQPSNITVLGKVYSSNNEIVSELKKTGIKVINTEFTNTEFDKVHIENCKLISKEISDNDTNILLDDGGYLINVSSEKKIDFAVEQTSSGFRLLENANLGFPVFNVARSKTKLTQESPLIARLVFERSLKYINNINKPKILVIGLGPIGNSIHQIFLANEYDAIGCDLEMSRKEIIEFLNKEKPDVIIGATGKEVIGKEDLETLEGDHPYTFISVSSSDREFPVSHFRDQQGIHDDVIYKNFIFANNGFPLTFMGERNELTPVEIEKTIALLLGSVLQGIVRDKSENDGFIEVPEELEDLINN